MTNDATPVALILAEGDTVCGNYTIDRLVRFDAKIGVYLARGPSDSAPRYVVWVVSGADRDDVDRVRAFTLSSDRILELQRLTIPRVVAADVEAIGVVIVAERNARVMNSRSHGSGSRRLDDLAQDDMHPYATAAVADSSDDFARPAVDASEARSSAETLVMSRTPPEPSRPPPLPSSTATIPGITVAHEADDAVVALKPMVTTIGPGAPGTRPVPGNTSATVVPPAIDSMPPPDGSEEAQAEALSDVGPDGSEEAHAEALSDVGLPAAAVSSSAQDAITTTPQAITKSPQASASPGPARGTQTGLYVSLVVLGAMAIFAGSQVYVTRLKHEHELEMLRVRLEASRREAPRPEYVDPDPMPAQLSPPPSLTARPATAASPPEVADVPSTAPSVSAPDAATLVSMDVPVADAASSSTQTRPDVLTDGGRTLPPMRPTPQEIALTKGRIQGAVARCLAGRGGAAVRLDVTYLGRSGRPSNVDIVGAGDDIAVLACVERSVYTNPISRFGSTTWVVNYAFRVP